MIPVKTKKQQEIMRQGGRLLAAVFKSVVDQVKPGISLSQLDQLADQLIEKQAGKASFKTVEDYRWASCLNLNQGVVHGIPNQTKIKKGDLVSLDLGLFYQGFHTDMARSFWVGVKDNGFLQVGKTAMAAAKAMALAGKRVGDISLAIETQISETGLTPIKSLTGHGIGKQLHQEPQIPCFLKGKISQTQVLAPGMSLAIEVIYARGKPDLALDDDGWTLETRDRKLAGLFEDTVLITDKKAETLTPLELRLTV